VSRLDTFDGLVAERDEVKERVSTVIETALHNVKNGWPVGGYAAQALRLRGAAVLLQTASLEVAALCGCYELAAAVSDSTLLDEEESE
jgi:hypothetical protein